MKQYWGYHLVMDCKNCDLDKVKNKENILTFIKTLVNDIAMKAYGEPIIEHFATHDPEAAGYSLVQLIETSSITGHFVDSNGDAYIDIFSCKEFSMEIAKNCVKKYFDPASIKIVYLTRQA
jgi:S-adenosylmethionine decarboxylase